MKKITTVLILILCTVLLSCSKKTAEAQPGKKSSDADPDKLTIGFSIDTLALERWRRDSDVFIGRVKDLGAQVIVQNAGNSVEEQEKQIQYLVKRGVKAIVVVPKSADSLSDSVKLARSRGIPVISYDRLMRNSDISLYVTIDTEVVGELMARELLKYSPGGKWFCLYGPEEDYNMTLMKRGVENTLKSTNARIDFVFYTAGWNYDISYGKMAELLRLGRIPDAIISGNDALANSLIQAIAEYAPGRNIPISGQDADIAGCQNVVTGKQTVTIYKPITELAKRAAELSVELAQGKTVAECLGNAPTIDNGYAQIPVLWLRPTAVTKENMDEVVIKSGFHTKDEIYRN